MKLLNCENCMPNQSDVPKKAVIVAIHQPNFFPWLGYFEKILKSDIFVFLDHVQFPKTGGTWSNRVKLLANGEAKWVTAPVNRAFHGVRSICQVEFRCDVPWRGDIMKFVEQQYKTAPHFADVMEMLAPLILNPDNNVATYNSTAVLSLAARLGVELSKFKWSSELPFEGNANELLISLVKSQGGTAYLCGGGASGYQDDSMFETAGLTLTYQNFKPHSYAQNGVIEFVPGLSIIDALMHVGVSEAMQLIAKTSST